MYIKCNSRSFVKLSPHVFVAVVQLLSCVWLPVTPELQHTRLPCPSLSPRVCSNSCPLSRWCYPTISPSAAPFSFCFQSFPASGSFPMNWLFTSGGQSVGASVSASVLPMNIQGWFPLGLTGWYPSSSLTLGLPIISVDHLLSPCNQLLQVIAFLTMPPQMWTQVPPQRTKDD